MFCSVLFCSVRTSSLADIQAVVFLLIHSQNVNWITRAQINPRREKMQISFYINQFHLWNNSMFLERICFFLFYPFSYLFMPNQFFDKKRTGVTTEQLKYLRDLTRTRVTKIPRISWMRHFSVNCFFTVKGNLFSLMARIRITTVLSSH